MEKIDKILEDLQSREKININTLKKPIKFKNTYVVCGKVFEFEVIPKDRWVRPKRYFCSDKCKMIHEEKLYRK